MPPEWEAISRIPMREPNYWLGKGLVVWFEQTNDSRLRLIAEIGPMEYTGRLSLLEGLEKVGLSFKEEYKIRESPLYPIFLSKVRC